MNGRKLSRRKAIKLGALSALSSAGVGSATENSLASGETERLICLGICEGGYERTISAEEIVNTIRDEGIEDNRIAGDLGLRYSNLSSNPGDIVGYKLLERSNGTYREKVFRKGYAGDSASTNSVPSEGKKSRIRDNYTLEDTWDSTQFDMVYAVEHEGEIIGKIIYIIEQKKPADYDGIYATRSDIYLNSTPLYTLKNCSSTHDYLAATLADFAPKGTGSPATNDEMSVSVTTPNAAELSYTTEIQGLELNDQPSRYEDLVKNILYAGWLPVSRGQQSHASTCEMGADDIDYCEVSFSGGFNAISEYSPPSHGISLSRRLFQY